MPLNRLEPRIYPKRRHFGKLELYQLSMAYAGTAQLLALSEIVLSRRSSDNLFRRSFRRRIQLSISLLLAMISDTCNIPRMRSAVPEGAEHLMVDHFNDTDFKEKFRFRKHTFHQLMVGFQLVDVMGHPTRVRVGQQRNPLKRSWINAETALLILLRRLAYPARLCDLTAETGCSRTLISDAFNHMVMMLYTHFVKPLYELERWVGFFPEWAARFVECGVPMDYLVGVIDGHFLGSARPGGDGCQKPNHHDFHTYNGHDRLHGLKFLSVVFPCGICIHFGLWTGNRHDAGALRQSKVSHYCDCSVCFYHCNPNCVCCRADSRSDEGGVSLVRDSISDFRRLCIPPEHAHAADAEGAARPRV